MKTITLFPTRSHCPSLSGSLMGMIRSLNGVYHIRAHYESRALEITFDEASISLESIIAAIGRETGRAFTSKPPTSDEGNITDKTR